MPLTKNVSLVAKPRPMATDKLSLLSVALLMAMRLCGYAPVAKSPQTGVCACTHRCVQAAGVTVSRAPKQDCCSLPGTASARLLER